MKDWTTFSLKSTRSLFAAWVVGSLYIWFEKQVFALDIENGACKAWLEPHRWY